MNKNELIKMAFSNLSRRKVRSFLAILGVIIGTSSVVLMVSIGLAMSKNVENQMATNENLHTVEIYGISKEPGKNTGAKKIDKMDDNAIKEISKMMGVSAVTPVLRANYNLIINNQYASRIDVMGVDPKEFEKFDIKVEEGRFFESRDKFSIVVGKGVHYDISDIRSGMWMPTDDKGNTGIDLVTDRAEITSDEKYKRDKINNFQNQGMNPDQNSNKVDYEVFKAKIVGVLESERNAWTSYMDLEGVKEIKKSDQEARKSAEGNSYYGEEYREGVYDQILVYIEDLEMVEPFCNNIKEMGFQFYSPIDMVKQSQQQFFVIQAALGGIGAISLLVASIGITNTMIMSIYERTKEIGVMKVLGARLADIRDLFLYEAGFIGLVGGAIGCTFSYLISIILNRVFGSFAQNMMGYGGMGTEEFKTYISYIPWWLALFAIIFACIIGLVAGYFPARRAMNMSALSSLSNE